MRDLHSNEDLIMAGEELSLPATKGDIIRLQGEIRDIAHNITELTRAVAVLEARPEHPQPCRDYLQLKQQFEQFALTHSPCRDLGEHLAMHKELMSDIRRNMVSLVTKAAGIALSAYAAGWAIYGAVWMLRHLQGGGG